MSPVHIYLPELGVKRRIPRVPRENISSTAEARSVDHDLAVTKSIWGEPTVFEAGY